MEKPVKETKEFYDYHKCVKYIEDKHKVNLRNYAGKTFKRDDDTPYQDFWHFVLECNCDISNGSFFGLCPEEWKWNAEPWQIEILDMFKEEFGEEIEFYVCW